MTKVTSQDQLHRFVFDQYDIRGEILSLNQSYSKATAHQNLPPAAKHLLGEFLAAASLIGEVLKFTGTLTIQARGAGPIPLIMAECNDDGSVRGIVKLADDHALDTLTNSSYKTLIGDGVLSFTLDPEQGQRYQGIVALEGETLADAFSNYFAQSEQLPTRLWLFADDHHAGGLLLQALPNQLASAEANQDTWVTAETLAQTLTHGELAELDHGDVLMRLFNEYIIRLFEPRAIHFGCHCSRERCCNALVSLGRKEADELLAERDIIEMGCEFCGTQYTFGAQDIQAIFANEDTRH